MEKKQIGTIIRKFRENKQIDQGDLATKAGMPQSALSRIEKGKRQPTEQTLEKIAKALSITLNEMLEEGNEDKKRSFVRTLPMLDECPEVWPPKRQHVYAEIPVDDSIWRPDRYVVKVIGNNMEPIFKDDDWITVDYVWPILPEQYEELNNACCVYVNPFTVGRLEINLGIIRVKKDSSGKPSKIWISIPRNEHIEQNDFEIKGSPRRIYGVVRDIIRRIMPREYPVKLQ